MSDLEELILKLQDENAQLQRTIARLREDHRCKDELEWANDELRKINAIVQRDMRAMEKRAAAERDSLPALQEYLRECNKKLRETTAERDVATQSLAEVQRKYEDCKRRCNTFAKKSKLLDSHEDGLGLQRLSEAHEKAKEELHILTEAHDDLLSLNEEMTKQLEHVPGWQGDLTRSNRRLVWANMELRRTERDLKRINHRLGVEKDDLLTTNHQMLRDLARDSELLTAAREETALYQERLLRLEELCHGGDLEKFTAYTRELEGSLVAAKVELGQLQYDLDEATLTLRQSRRNNRRLKSLLASAQSRLNDGAAGSLDTLESYEDTANESDWVSAGDHGAPEEGGGPGGEVGVVKEGADVLRGREHEIRPCCDTANTHAFQSPRDHAGGDTGMPTRVAVGPAGDSGAPHASGMPSDPCGLTGSVAPLVGGCSGHPCGPAGPRSSDNAGPGSSNEDDGVGDGSGGAGDGSGGVGDGSGGAGDGSGGAGDGSGGAGDGSGGAGDGSGGAGDGSGGASDGGASDGSGGAGADGSAGDGADDGSGDGSGGGGSGGDGSGGDGSAGEGAGDGARGGNAEGVDDGGPGGDVDDGGPGGDARNAEGVDDGGPGGDARNAEGGPGGDARNGERGDGGGTGDDGLSGDGVDGGLSGGVDGGLSGGGVDSGLSGGVDGGLSGGVDCLDCGQSAGGYNARGGGGHQSEDDPSDGGQGDGDGDGDGGGDGPVHGGPNGGGSSASGDVGSSGSEQCGDDADGPRGRPSPPPRPLTEAAFEATQARTTVGEQETSN